MKKCLNCGEPAKYTHPEYSGDRLCGECLICELNVRMEQADDELREAEKLTGIKSDDWPEQND